VAIDNILGVAIVVGWVRATFLKKCLPFSPFPFRHLLFNVHHTKHGVENGPPFLLSPLSLYKKVFIYTYTILIKKGRKGEWRTKGRMCVCVCVCVCGQVPISLRDTIRDVCVSEGMCVRELKERVWMVCLYIVA
jgi:hypothetical protein